MGLPIAMILRPFGAAPLCLPDLLYILYKCYEPFILYLLIYLLISLPTFPFIIVKE